MRKQLLLITALLGGFFAVQGIAADTRNVYIHGYQAWLIGDPISSYNCQNSTGSCKYWNGQDQKSNKVHVGWLASEAWPFFGVPRAMAVLDSNCRSSAQYCTVICHSTGCPIIEYILANFGSRYYINYVSAHGSAEGGTNFAEIGKLFGPLTGTGVYYLSESVVRSFYDHNNTNGKTIYQTAGSRGNIVSIFLQGEDDGVVPFHSACGYNRIFGANKCNGDRYYCPVWYNPFRFCDAGKYANRRSRDAGWIDHGATLNSNYQNQF